MSAKLDLVSVLRSVQFKRITIFQPVIRHFDLKAVLNLLLEHTVAITDPAAVSCVSECGEGIHKAGSQSSQTTVAECRIRLLIFDHIEIQADLIQRFPHFFIFLQIDQIIAERASHQKFHRHVVHDLWIFLVKYLLCCKPSVIDDILDREGDRLENFLLIRLLQCLAV